MLKRESLENFGSLITIKETNRCLGDLLFLESISDRKGAKHKNVCFCPNNGQVEVTKEESVFHNAALDKAKLEGLDKNCEIGQGSFAYYTGKGNVTTFIGTVISSDVHVKGRAITFKRNGKTFRGILRKQSEDFNYKRIN